MNHQIRKLRLAGSELQPPCDACAFFHNKDEEYDVLLPFITEGSRKGDKAFRIIDERQRAEHLARLAAVGIDVARETRSGRLEVRGWVPADRLVRELQAARTAPGTS